MTKQLYILRHAQAAGSMDQADIDRPLSDHGVKQAQMIGEHLENIDLVLCSGALRTRQTLKEAIKYHGAPKTVKYKDDLYCAPTDTLFKAVQHEDAENILIIAHNPGIFQFAYMMAEDEDTTAYAKLMSGYPPCSLTILDCPIDNWFELDNGQNKLNKFIRGDSILSE